MTELRGLDQSSLRLSWRLDAFKVFGFEMNDAQGRIWELGFRVAWLMGIGAWLLRLVVATVSVFYSLCQHATLICH